MSSIGNRLKEMRLQLRLTQEELATRCELSKGYISQLENDLTSPSITTLMDILSALGSTPAEFFNKEEEPQIVFTEEDFFVRSSHDSDTVWLVPNSQKNTMEPILFTLKAHSTQTKDLPHEGEEFGYVLKGELSLDLGGQKHRVKAGDSFYYSASKLHYLENTTDEDATLVWVSCPPSF